MSGRKIQGTCGCGRPAAIKETGPDGDLRYRSNCSACRKEARKHKKDFCEKCKNNTDLEVDHIDGNRSNNDPSNLQTLCKPCHIEKTIKERTNEKM